MKSIIDERMKLFDKYLARGNGMDRKEYQVEGVRWCLNNEIRVDPLCNVRGGFIADEMGLGKTIMMIGTFVVNFLPRTLIVVPPVLLEQWASQIYRTTGHTALIYHGSKKKDIDLEILNKAVIVITTYGAISLTKEKDSKKVKTNILYDVQWSRIVFDEAHHLRSMDTMCYTGAAMLKSDIRWLVSGTPVQNSKKDFYALCSALKLPVSFYTNSENLRLLAKTFILKRSKKQVGIQLPEVLLNKNIVQWKNKKEQMLSETIHSVLAFSNVSNKTVDFESVNNAIPLVMLLRARQSCIYPKLMEKNIRKLVRIGINAECFREALEYSSKLDSVVDCIAERKGNGNGKLVFCHFKEEIDEIAKRLLVKGFDSVAIFDGRTLKKNKNNVLNAKNEVLILQIQTGCEGLNLQENYSEIYFVSPHWNPCVEDQAIARCHRIGQTKEVNVTRFEMNSFTKDEDSEFDTLTIDKYVTRVQDVKRVIADECINVSQ